MKKDWTYKKLGEVAKVVHGKNQKDVLSEDGQYPIYGSGGNIMGYANDYLCEAGTTILGRKGSINNPIFIEEPFWNVDTAFGISAKEGNDSKYLYYFIKSIDWQEKNTGTTLPSLTQQVVKDVDLPVPSLSEQSRIVSRLDAAFGEIEGLKAKAEAQLREARTLFQAALTQEMKPKQGWEEKKLGEVAKVQNGFAFKSNLFRNEGFPIVRISNIQNEEIDTKGIVYFSKEDYDVNFNGYRIFPNDILIAMSGGTTGKIGINQTDNIFYQNQRVGVIREDEKKLNHRYLYYYLHTKSEESLKIAAGAAQPNLSTAQIKDFEIPLPPLSVQQQIVSRLDALSEKVRELEEVQKKVVAECDALKQALLREVFE